jgi:hypothetical protein
MFQNHNAAGFPSNDIQVFEIYNSIAQTRARTHPALAASQRALLTLWHASDPTTRVSMRTPISYYDRLRIRKPGDRSFTLGPHIDGGSIERWEDPGLRRCWSRILQGQWRDHDPFDVSPRIGARTDLYNGSCAPFVLLYATRLAELRTGASAASSVHGRAGHRSRRLAQGRARFASARCSLSRLRILSCARSSVRAPQPQPVPPPSTTGSSTLRTRRSRGAASARARK